MNRAHQEHRPAFLNRRLFGRGHTHFNDAATRPIDQFNQSLFTAKGSSFSMDDLATAKPNPASCSIAPNEIERRSRAGQTLELHHFHGRVAAEYHDKVAFVLGINLRHWK